jgi:hypothetical protein
MPVRGLIDATQFNATYFSKSLSKSSKSGRCQRWKEQTPFLFLWQTSSKPSHCSMPKIRFKPERHRVSSILDSTSMAVGNNFGSRISSAF